MDVEDATQSVPPHSPPRPKQLLAVPNNTVPANPDRTCEITGDLGKTKISPAGLGGALDCAFLTTEGCCYRSGDDK